VDDPWWVKLSLAQHRLKEVETAVGLYASRHPYAAIPGGPRQQDGKPNARRYIIRITEEPDPIIAALIGEFISALRSAMDNIVVAIAPSKRQNSAGFPIATEDLWAKDDSGAFLIPDNQTRTSFESRLKDLPPDVVAIIQGLQPYRLGDQARLDPLGIVSRLDNENKHRGLIATAGAVFNVHTTVRVGIQILEQFAYGTRPDGAEVAYFDQGHPQPPNAEVQVQIRGTATVQIPEPELQGSFPVPGAFVAIPYYVMNEVLLPLEQYVPRPGNVAA
jgi:hypothetical protein